MSTIDEARRAAMMRTVHEYFLACNTASRARFAEVLAPGCVHYFPPGVGGPYRGRDAIADLWIGFVRAKGSCWTIDRMVCDGRDLVIEWTHFKPAAGEHIRGSEWYEFDEQGLITAIWAHYASPRDAGRPVNELEGFDYVRRSYPVGAPTLDAGTLEERHRNIAREEGA
jgi:methyltransferase